MDKLIVPASLFLSTLGFGVVAAWYVKPALDRLPRDAALVPLILPHAFRHIGLWFLVPGVVAPTIAPDFAGPAAWGDLAAAGMAWLGIIALRAGWSIAPISVWAFSVVGLVDLAHALVQGNRLLASPGDLGATFLIPSLIVPALLVSHVLVVQRMLQPSAAPQSAS
jgi:hypothetical protein